MLLERKEECVAPFHRTTNLQQGGDFLLVRLTIFPFLERRGCRQISKWGLMNLDGVYFKVHKPLVIGHKNFYYDVFILLQYE